MNYNKIYKPTYEHFPDKKLNRRAKLDTGTYCNYSCSFCYYYDRLDERTNFDVIKDRINYIKDSGMIEVDLSGGESSIHADWFKILDYCASLNLKISCLSNGSTFHNMNFLKKSKEHGLTEVLFSLHGSNTEEHDRMVNKKGAFNKILKSIENCKELNITVRINCTVTKDNYQSLSTEYVNLILNIMPSQINFLTLNYWSDAKKLNHFSYKESTPEIKKCIDILKDKMEINVRYTPFCFMEGYEEYVIGYYQHIFDLKDWNIALYDCDIASDELRNNLKHNMFEAAFKNRNRFYYKTKDCLNCKYIYVCDGYENEK